MRKVLIIEDEPRAVNRLNRLLSKARPDWEVVATADTIQGAVDIMHEHADADVAFFDIQLADGLSFEALEKVSPGFPVIFVTAYDHFAVRAFEHFSLDYLLKPAGEEELSRALIKVERTWNKNEEQPQDLQQILKYIQNSSQEYKERFLSKIGDKLRFIETAEIHGFFSENKITYALAESGKKHPLESTLEDISQQIDPKRFFRINRKFILSTQAISEIVSWSNSRLRVTVKGMEEEVIVVARERTSDFKSWLDS